MIERDQCGIVHYDNSSLGISTGEYPKNFNFFQEGSEQKGTIDGKNVWKVGVVSAIPSTRPEKLPQFDLFVFEGNDAIHALARERMIYERKR